MGRTQAKRMCDCIKDVTRKVKLRKKLAPSKEGAAIAICTKSILWPQKRTIKSVNCKGDKPKLFTQKRKSVQPKKKESE
jgi:hypothetical protein